MILTIEEQLQAAEEEIEVLEDKCIHYEKDILSLRDMMQRMEYEYRSKGTIGKFRIPALQGAGGGYIINNGQVPVTQQAADGAALQGRFNTGIGIQYAGAFQQAVNYIADQANTQATQAMQDMLVYGEGGFELLDV